MGKAPFEIPDVEDLLPLELVKLTAAALEETKDAPQFMRDALIKLFRDTCSLQQELAVEFHDEFGVGGYAMAEEFMDRIIYKKGYGSTFTAVSEENPKQKDI